LTAESGPKADSGAQGRAAEVAQHHLPFAKPPKATRPMSVIIRPIQKLQTIIKTMPMMTRMPPRPIRLC
jgi:hypothetical protein